VTENLYVPVGAVTAIYARETGAGMGFEVEEPSTDNAPATNSSTAGFAGGSQAQAPETVSPSATPSATATDPKRPTLTIVK
jgi:stringent starvation protein B